MIYISVYVCNIYTVKWSTSSLNGKNHYVVWFFLNKMGDGNTTVSHRNNFFLSITLQEWKENTGKRKHFWWIKNLVYSALLYSCCSPYSLFFHGEGGVSSFGLLDWILAVSSWMSEHLGSIITWKQLCGDRLGFILFRWWLYGICGTKIYQNRYKYKYGFLF